VCLQLADRRLERVVLRGHGDGGLDGRAAGPDGVVAGRLGGDPSVQRSGLGLLGAFRGRVGPVDRALDGLVDREHHGLVDGEDHGLVDGEDHGLVHRLVDGVAQLLEPPVRLVTGWSTDGGPGCHRGE